MFCKMNSLGIGDTYFIAFLEKKSENHLRLFTCYSVKRIELNSFVRSWDFPIMSCKVVTHITSPQKKINVFLEL